MGLFDDVRKFVGLGGSLTQNPALMQALVQMLSSGQSGGGLAGIVQGFQKAGLGEAVSSWVSTGPNLPISPDQVQQGLGAERLQELVKSSGLSQGAAASVLAGLLPTVIDKLTPEGKMPQAAQLQQIAATLKGALGG